MQQGDVSSIVVYLVSGSVSVVADGCKRASIEAPAMIGHHSFIYRRARTAAIVCEGHVAYFQVALDELLAACSSAPEAAPAAATRAPVSASNDAAAAAAAADVKGGGSTSVALASIDPADVSHPLQQDVSHTLQRDVSHTLQQLHSLQPPSAATAINTGLIARAQADTAAAGAPSNAANDAAVVSIMLPPFLPPMHARAPNSRGAFDTRSSTVNNPTSPPAAMAGLSISDSLGIMMRQQEARSTVCKPLAAALTTVCRKLTPLRKLCWALSSRGSKCLYAACPAHCLRVHPPF